MKVVDFIFTISDNKKKKEGMVNPNSHLTPGQLALFNAEGPYSSEEQTLKAIEMFSQLEDEVEVIDFYLHRCWEQEDAAEMIDLYMEAEGLY